MVLLPSLQRKEKTSEGKKTSYCEVETGGFVSFSCLSNSIYVCMGILSKLAAFTMSTKIFGMMDVIRSKGSHSAKIWKEGRALP